MREKKMEANIESLRLGSIRVLLAMIATLLIVEYIRGLHYIEGEWNEWTYLSSLMYFIAGELCILTAILAGYYYNQVGDLGHSRTWITWAGAGVAFIYFACDEMLKIHEQLGILVERVYPWYRNVYPGHFDNVIIGLYVLVSLAYAGTFMKEIKKSPKARPYLILGFILIGAAALTDLAPKAMVIRYLPFGEAEELCEMFSGFAFAAAFISTCASMLTKITRMLHTKVTVESGEEYSVIS